jgi:hypothetical protein
VQAANAGDRAPGTRKPGTNGSGWLLRLRLMRRLPWFSIVLLGAILAIGISTEFDRDLFAPFRAHFALDWDDLSNLELQRLIMNPLLQTAPGIGRNALWLALLVIPIYELRSGEVRTALTFYLGDWLSSLSVLVALYAAGTWGNATAARLAAAPDSGSSCGIFACMTALALSLPRRPRAISLAMIAAFLLVRIAGWHHLYDFQHALAALTGAGLWFAFERFSAWRRRRSPREDDRASTNGVGGVKRSLTGPAILRRQHLQRGAHGGPTHPRTTAHPIPDHQRREGRA